MLIPKEEFAARFDWARAHFTAARAFPLIDLKVQNLGLLSDAYEEVTDNDGTRDHLESQLAHSQDETAIRFVILNY